MNAAVQLYQIAYDAASFARIEPDYLLLDNRSNERPDWYEYWPIRQFLLSHHLDDQAFYGFFSPKFAAKTLLAAAQVKTFVQAHAERADILLFSPQPDLGAFFLNVFEQAEFFDPGLIEAYEALLASIGRSVPLRTLVMDSQQVVFSNYFVARPAFWREWLLLNEALFAVCEGPASSLREALCLPTTYPGAAQRKIFIQERAASLLLATQPHWRSIACNPFDMGWSMLSFRNHPVEAVMGDALKTAFRRNPYPQYMQAYEILRERFRATPSVKPASSGL